MSIFHAFLRLFLIAAVICFVVEGRAEELDSSIAAQGLESVETSLEEHLASQTSQNSTASETEEMASEIYETPIPEEIPFEDDENLIASAPGDIASEPEKLYEKAETLEPNLMLRGKPVEEVCEADARQRLKGKIVPEKQQINRRRHMLRWVLQTEDRQRIPLKSNLQLLTIVRKDDLLDGPVLLTGYFVKSGFNENLQYFNVEKAVPAGDSEEEQTTGKENSKGKSSAKKKKR